MRILLLTPDGVEALRDGPAEAPPTVALADDVVAFRIALGEGSPRAALDEARMRATDLAAQPVEDLHLVLGPTQQDGSAWMAIIARERMAERLAQLHAQGVMTERLVPAALLLPEPAGAETTQALVEGGTVLRAADHAATMEPDLVGLTGAAPSVAGPLAAVIDPALAATAPNLLSGEFAPRRRWWRDRRFQLSAILLSLLALLLAAAPWLLDRQQLASVARGHDAATRQVAEQALGQPFAAAGEAADALAMARAAREAGSVSARISAVAAAAAEVPGARVAEIRSDAAGHVTLSLAGSADAINRLRARLETGAFETGGQGAILTLGARRGAVAVGDDVAALALVRRYNATADAAILAAVPAKGAAAVPIAEALAAAGLEPEAGSGTGAAATVIPAVRSTLLLPLIARLEAAGVRFGSVRITANADQTVRAVLVRRP